MGGRVGRLVKVDDTAGDVGFDIALVGGTTIGDGSPMVGADEHVVVALQKEGELIVVHRGSGSRRGHDDILGDGHRK